MKNVKHMNNANNQLSYGVSETTTRQVEGSV